MMAAAAMLFAGCAHEELDTPFQTGVVAAVMESDDTKSNATDQGYFTWATGDNIWINTTHGNLKATLSDGEGTSNATFSYSYMDGQELTGYAMYPYSAKHKIESGVITFNMPASYDLGTTISNTNAPMLAVPTARNNEGTVNFNFSHLGGVIRVIFKNAPVGTDKFTLSLGGAKINGDFEVEDGIISSVATENDEENITTLNFTALTSVKDITLFVPIPVGNYTGIEAKLYKGTEELGTWGSTTAVNNVERKSLILMSPITFSTAGGNIENDQQVSSAGELAAAVANGGTITITEGITLGQEIVIPADKEVVIDLNGNTINVQNLITIAEGAKLTLVNNTPTPMVKSGEVVSGAKIISSTDIIKASKDAVITIGEGVELTTTGAGASVIWIPANAENVTVNSAGVLKATAEGGATISHNGTLKSGNINITGGSVVHEEDVAMYIAGNADVTISGDAVIKGTTAVEVRAGKLEVTGGKFIATASPSEYKPNGNGTTSKGVALAMCKHNTTENTLEVVINGGEFIGAKSILVNSDLGPVSLTVNSGTFSDPTPCYYLGDAANVTVNMKDSYEGPGFVVNAGQTVTLNMDTDVVYNVTNPLVGSAGTQTLGFQFKNGSTVSINGGKITSSDAKMLINNYTNLTLTDTELAPSIPDTMNGQVYYVLSNNSGEVNINGSTSITAPTKDGIKSFAFDVCKYASYVEPKVIWNSTGVVTGGVELSGGEFVVSKDLVLSNPIKVVNAAKMTVNADITPVESWNAGDALVIVNRKGNLTLNGNGSIDAEVNSNVWAAVKMTEAGENDPANSADLTVNDVTLKGYYYGITGNGNRHNTNITVNSGNIVSNCSSDGHAIYHPQIGTLTVNGGTLEGHFSAIEHRGGALTITGGKFNATYTPTVAEQNGNGTSIKGAAIAVSKHKGVSDLSLSISGGTFTGHSALYEEYTEADTYAATGEFVVTGGTFNGKVYSENYKDFITGGTFTDPSAFDYLGNNADVTLGANITLSSVVNINKTVTINLNGKDIIHPASSGDAYGDVFDVLTGGNLTILGEGRVISENGYSVYAGGDAKVLLEKGKYYSPVSAVYAQKAAVVTIVGGEYYADVEPTPNTPEDSAEYGHNFTLNLRDKKNNNVGDTSEIIVKGGKFYMFNPADNIAEGEGTNFVAPGYSSVADGDYYEVKEGVFNETSLKAAIVNGAEITLSADMTIEKAITIPTDVTATINLNGFDVTAPNTDVFEVAGTLTIKGTEESVVSAGTANPNASVCAVWANGGTVTINGGYYKAYSDAAGKRNDCIYAGYNADNNNTAGKITINGGKFEYVWPGTKNSGIDYNGDMFLLNCADKDLYETLITVNAGQFKNNVPSYEATTPSGRPSNEVRLGDGKKVYNGETEVTAAHNGTTDIWYVVK